MQHYEALEASVSILTRHLRDLDIAIPEPLSAAIQEATDTVSNAKVDRPTSDELLAALTSTKDPFTDKASAAVILRALAASSHPIASALNSAAIAQAVETLRLGLGTAADEVMSSLAVSLSDAVDTLAQFTEVFGPTEPHTQNPAPLSQGGSAAQLYAEGLSAMRTVRTIYDAANTLSRAVGDIRMSLRALLPGERAATFPTNIDLWTLIQSGAVNLPDTLAGLLARLDEVEDADEAARQAARDARAEAISNINRGTTIYT